MKRFGFLRHYKKIKIEGFNLSSIVNKCIKNGIVLKNLRWHNSLESTVDVQGDDFGKFKKMAGHSYRMTVVKEGGAIPLFRNMKANVITVIGAFLLGALIFYQGLFVAEIRIDGYKSISEESIRKTLADAGLYEGAKKQEDYNSVKTALYQEHDEITWVSIFEEGRLIKVKIAEAGKEEEPTVAEDTPVNIVATKAGMIEKILPLQGNAKVQKGDYVNPGDVLISGRFKYQSSDYSRGDEEFTMYSHAKGQVYAKVPKQLTYYLEKKERIKEPTGRFTVGIYLKFGDVEMDTAKSWSRYEASVRSEKTVIDTVNPLPVTISFVKVEEVVLKEKPADMKKLRKVVEAALRQYEKENLKEGEEIISQTIDFYEMENVIKASALIETLEEIGEEKEIKVKKDEKNKENKEEKAAE